MAGQVLFGRGPDGTNTRVNEQGVGIPFGTPNKATLYNPGTLAQRMAIRMMQERARKRVAAGGQAQSNTYQANMAEWNAAQAQANDQLTKAQQKYAATGAKPNDLLDGEFDVNNFLPDYLRADRGRSRILEEQRKHNMPPGQTWLGDKDTILDVSPKNPNDWQVKGPDPLGLDALKPSPLTDIQWTPGSEAPAGAVVPPERTDLILGSDAPGSPMGDPTLEKYKKLRADWLDAASKGETDAPNTGADGNFGTTSTGTTSLTQGISEGTAFPYFLVGTGADKTIEKAPKLYTKMVAEALADPQKAGELMATLAAIGAYPGASEKYVQDRLYPVTGKDGKPTLKGRFTQEDADALRVAMSMMADDQANIADAALAGGQGIAAVPGFEELLAQRGLERQDMASTLQPAGNSSGGGGGGRRHYGGGGGGGGGAAARFTDPEQLKSLVDGIARQRLGRILTTEEAQQFATYYHSQEAATGGVNFTSGGGRVIDPESQAIAWIESRFRDEGAKQQQGSFVGALLKMLQGSAFTGGIGGGA